MNRKILEAHTLRATARRDRPHCCIWKLVCCVLPNHEGGVAVLFEDLANSGVLRTDDGIVAAGSRWTIRR